MHQRLPAGNARQARTASRERGCAIYAAQGVFRGQESQYVGNAPLGTILEQRLGIAAGVPTALSLQKAAGGVSLVNLEVTQMHGLLPVLHVPRECTH